MNNPTYARAALPLSEAQRGLQGMRRDLAPEVMGQDTGNMASLHGNPQTNYQIDKEINNLRQNAQTAVPGKLSEMKNQQTALEMFEATDAYRAQQDLQEWTAGIMEGQAPATAALGAMIEAGDDSVLRTVAAAKNYVNGMNLA